jgi:hypothetical protein
MTFFVILIDEFGEAPFGGENFGAEFFRAMGLQGSLGKKGWRVPSVGETPFHFQKNGAF